MFHLAWFEVMGTEGRQESVWRGREGGKRKEERKGGGVKRGRRDRARKEEKSERRERKERERERIEKNDSAANPRFQNPTHPHPRTENTREQDWGTSDAPAWGETCSTKHCSRARAGCRPPTPLCHSFSTT